MALNIKPSENQEVSSINDKLSRTPLLLAAETKQIDTIKHPPDNATLSKREECFSAKTGDWYDLKNTQCAVIVAHATQCHTTEATILLDALRACGFQPTTLKDYTKECMMKKLTSLVEKPPSAIMMFICPNRDKKIKTMHFITKHLHNLHDIPKVLVLDSMFDPDDDLYFHRFNGLTRNWLIGYSSFSKFAKQLTDGTGSEELHDMLRRLGSDSCKQALIISTMHWRLFLGRSFERTEAYMQQKTLEVALSAVSENKAPYDCYDLKNTQTAVIVAYATKKNSHAKQAKILLDALTACGFHPTILEDFTEECLMEALTSAIEKSPSVIMLLMCCQHDGYVIQGAYDTDWGRHDRILTNHIMNHLNGLSDLPKVLVLPGMQVSGDKAVTINQYCPWYHSATRNWLIAITSIDKFAKQLSDATVSEDLFDILRRSSSDSLTEDKYCEHIIISSLNTRLLVERSFARTEVHGPSVVWSELYKTVNFNALAKAFLCQQDSPDAAEEENEHPRPPNTNEVMITSSTWSSLYSAVNFEELAEAFSGLNTCPGEIQELPRDTGENSNAGKDDMNKSGQPPAKSSGSDSGPNGNSRGTDHNQEAEADKDIESSLESKNDTAVNSQSERAFTVGLCNHSTKSMEYDVFFCATNAEGGCANKRLGRWMHISANESSISTSINLTNAVRYVEMVLCMPHYQMVWMNVLDEHFVLINAALSDYKNAKLKSEHIRNVLETLLKELRGKREVNIIMRYDEMVNFPKGESKEKSQDWDGHYSEPKDGEKRWLLCKARDKRTPPPDTCKGYFRFKIADNRDPEHSGECGNVNANGKLRATTWNVCGKRDVQRGIRIDKILQNQQLKDSEVIFFQEFPPGLLYEFSCNHEQFSKVFGWRPLETGNFLYTASLVRRESEQKNHFKEVRLEDKILKCNAVIDGRNWVTMNCHLKSNVHGTKDENLQTRTSSFETIRNLAGDAAYILIGGDMNMLDEETSANNLTNFNDVWLLAKSIRGDYTHTWDPKNSFNLYILDCDKKGNNDGKLVSSREAALASRFDRFYLRANFPGINGYQHLGTEKVILFPRAEIALHVSDHYGVWTEITFK